MSSEATNADDFLRYFASRQSEMLTALGHLVNMESPSEDAKAIDAFAAALQIYVTSEVGGNPEIIRTGPRQSPHVLARLGERTDVLFIGHFDTVYGPGISEHAPFRVEGDKAFGAGVLDMKAGLVLMTEVAKRLKSQLIEPNLTLFFNSDEEVASPDSRFITRELAAEAKLVVVFEFTTDEAEVKIGSRGNRPYRVTVSGRGGHAAYPEQLSNPITALFEVATQLSVLNQPQSGQVVVPTIVEAGDRTNVVPESATMTFDVRYSDDATIDKIEEALSAVTFNDPNLVMSFEAMHDVPLHRADASSYAFNLAKQCASEFGLDLRGIEARGASDLNYAGSVNPNVIEALGACGGGAHSADREFLYVSSLARRAALSALMTEQALLDALSENQQVTATSQGR